MKKIQRCWREYRAYRLRRNKKNLSISSSLITIKDFNESIKEERLRYGIEKENSFSNRKMDLKEILREIMEEAAVDESIKLRLRNIHRLQETNVNNNTASQQLTMKSVECGQST